MMRSAVRTAARVRTCAIRGGIRASTHPRQLWKIGMGLPYCTGVGLHNLAFMEENCTLARTPRISERTGIYQQNVAVGCASPNDEVPPLFFRFLKRCETVMRLFLRVISLLAIWSPVAISSPVGLGLPFIPRTVSAQLREYWLRVLLRVIELSGPTFIKAAQWASTRRDSFPEEVCKTLGRLHTFTRRKSQKYGEDAVEAAFGASWRQFLELEDKILGSGAVAQVYKGRMVAGRYKGTPVAIKVIHPKTKKTVELDLSLMRGMANLLEMFPRVRWLSLPEIVDEFGKLMESQLDLQREAQNLERFAHDFEDDPGVVFPRPLHPWVTDTVLVEEYKEGEPISSFFGGSETKKLAQMGLNTFLKMVFFNNFVHGDLHPGNLMVGRTQDSTTPHLIMLDAGIVCELDYGDRKNFVDLFYAVVVGDGKLAGRLMIKRARSQRCKDADAFCEGIHALVQRARSSGLRLGQIQAGELLKRMFALCLKHEVKMESKFASVLVAIAVLEGVGRSLDPDCNILQASLPVVTQASAMISGRSGNNSKRDVR